MSLRRDSLNGVWILDKSRRVPSWSMSEYLRTMEVDELAIEAHEKGDREQDTIHTITITPNNNKVRIVKQSRVNNNVVVQLELGQEHTEYLSPGDRPKTSLATSDNPSHLRIQSYLQTVNGRAKVIDIKTLQQEDDKTVLRQQLTIVNEENGQSSTTTRYFIPYRDTTTTSPHVVVPDDIKQS